MEEEGNIKGKIEKIIGIKETNKENKTKEQNDLGIDDILKAEADKRGDILDYKNHKSNKKIIKF